MTDRQLMLFWQTDYFPKDWPRLPSVRIWRYWNGRTS